MPKYPSEKNGKRIKYDAAFRAEALRLAEQSRRGECYDNAQAESL